MGQKNIEEIVLSKIAGQELTTDELIQFDRWYSDEANRSYYESLLRVRSGILASRAAKVDDRKAWELIVRPTPRPSFGKRLFRYAAAIALPLLLAGGYLIYQNTYSRTVTETAVVKPGNPKAILTSSSGNRLVLSEAEETLIENGSGTIRIKGAETLDNDAEIAYSDIMQRVGIIPCDKGTIYSTLEVPRGGYICFSLSDGSKVWLNSESRLRFPMVFMSGARIVELEGEAYFQVSKDQSRPFTVKTGDYDIRVTGTEFNVQSYGRGMTATTLIKGSVEVEMDGTVSKLTPGCQATVENGRILTREVDVTRYVAWQHGEFCYSQTPLSEIMSELSRWYDMEVVWKDTNTRNYHFSAWFDRQSEIGEIIDVFNKTNRIEMIMNGKTLTIQDKIL